MCKIAAFVGLIAIGIGIVIYVKQEKKMIEPYQCHFTSVPLTIDGKLDEASWEKAANIAFYIPKTNATPVSLTEAKALWDDDYLYVGFKAYDKDIWSYFTERDSTTCQEDVLEVFIKPSEETETYYNFEINALNTVYDAMNLKRNAGGPAHHRWRRWDCDGLKSAVLIKGEINNPDVIDEYWQLEIAIPFKSLPTLKGNCPKPGSQWRFHLARYDYSIHLDAGVELSSSADFKNWSAGFHGFEYWNTLEFVK
jgi:hypothetical protein